MKKKKKKEWIGKQTNHNNNTYMYIFRENEYRKHIPGHKDFVRRKLNRWKRTKIMRVLKVREYTVAHSILALNSATHIFRIYYDLLLSGRPLIHSSIMTTEE